MLDLDPTQDERTTPHQFMDVVALAYPEHGSIHRDRFGNVFGHIGMHAVVCDAQPVQLPHLADAHLKRQKLQDDGG